MRSHSIDKTNQVHQTAWIEDGAKIGKNNYFGPFCYVGSNVEIADNNHFAGFCSVGMAAEHRDFYKQEGRVQIGSRNMVREHTTINGGTKWITMMNDCCTMLRGSHLSHDSVLEKHVTLSCNALVGGESYLMQGCNLALGAVIHQRQTVGSWAMLGMGAVGTKKLVISPGNIYVGNPARNIKRNEVGLARANVDQLMLQAETDRFFLLRELIAKGQR